MASKKKVLSRRDFINRGAGMASLGFLGLAGKKLGSKELITSKTVKKGKINYRQLGKTGIKIPVVNMGVMNSENPELVRKSYEIGVRYFDTAAHYQRGKNEQIVGGVIKELNARDKVIIGTKIYIPHSQRGEMSSEQKKEFFLNEANECLKRLQTDYIDILMIHNVQKLEYLNDPGIIEALNTIKKSGKTRFIGFSTHNYSTMPELINSAAETGRFDVIETAFNYSMFDYNLHINAMKKAYSNGIGFLAMKTQCMQPWYKPSENSVKRKYYEGKINHPALLKWVLSHDFITSAIPGYTNFEQMEEDFSVVYDLRLTPEEKKYLEDRNIKLSLLSVCKQCGKCETTCPKGVMVPELIRTHMYAASYNNFFKARQTLDDIPEDKGIKNCLECNECSAKCAYRVNIPRRIEELKLIYG